MVAFPLLARRTGRPQLADPREELSRIRKYAALSLQENIPKGLGLQAVRQILKTG